MVENNNKIIVKNTIFLYVRSVIILLITLYTTRVVLRALGIEDYGVLNVVGGFVSMFAFLNASMTKAIQRFFNFAKGKDDPQNISNIYTTSLLIQALLAVVVVAVIETVGLWALNNYLVIPEGRERAAFWVFQYSTLSTIFTIMSAPYTAAIIAHEKMNIYAYISILDAFLKLGVAVSLMFVPFDKLVFYGSLSLIISAINFVIYLVYSKKHYPELVFSRSVVTRQDFMQILSFSGWNMLAAFSNIMKSQGVNVLLNRFFGTVVNAARGVSSQIMSALRMLVDNIQIAVKPQMVQSYAKGEINRTFDLMFFTSKISFLLMYLFALPIVLEIDLILHLWLGDSVPEYTAIFTLLIILVSLVDCLNAPVSFVIQAANKMKRYHLVYSIILLLIVPVSYVVLKMGGNPTTVFWVSIGVGIVNQVACLYVLKKEVPFSMRKYVNKVILPCLLTFVLSPIIPVLLRFLIPESIFRAVIVAAISVTITTLIVLFLGCDQRERQFIRSFVNRKK